MILKLGIDYTEIWTDLDGVLRGLDIAALGKEAEEWGETNPEGKSTTQIIDEAPELILKAPRLEYCGILHRLPPPITILTHQHKGWIPYTEKWVETNLKGLETRLIYTKSAGEKMRYLKNGILLIEDHPKFSDYSKVVLVRRKYNKHVEAPYSVKNPTELIELLGL